MLFLADKPQAPCIRLTVQINDENKDAAVDIRSLNAIILKRMDMSVRIYQIQVGQHALEDINLAHTAGLEACFATIAYISAVASLRSAWHSPLSIYSTLSAFWIMETGELCGAMTVISKLWIRTLLQCVEGSPPVYCHGTAVNIWPKWR